jgi:voltage-dependent potassium channel beta subunit
MQYRNLGRAGIKVSALSLGSWITYGPQVQLDSAIEMLRYAYEKGVNFFDNAEVYSKGRSEEIMGEALQRLGWRRGSYLVSTKLYWGLHESPNEKNTLNRKYLLESIEGSLKRLRLDYVDLLLCHRPDPSTPVEETVWAMHDIVSRGMALYWGTSEWSATAIAEAYKLAEKHHLRKPVTEQPQYNLFFRERVEQEYAPLYEEFGMSTTTWSPLCSGLLTGKYSNGVPADSRMALSGYEWLRDRALTPEKIAAVERLRPIARELDCSLCQLAIAWCLKNPYVSTVLLGASKLAQLEENLGALEVAKRLTEDTQKAIESAVGHFG